jgi:lipid II:glycine glycyltransferase (peptidoglycan interpeptide bridge formation enzyme)
MEIVNPLNQHVWDELVSSHPSGSFFHTSSWARVLAESYGYKPAYFVVRDKGYLLALLPVMEIRSILTGKRGVSLPFSDYADPFAKDEEQYLSLAKTAMRYGTQAGWKTLEIRGGGYPWAEKEESSVFLGHQLDLSGTESEIYTGFRTNMRRNISRALKAGVKIEILNSAEAIEAYYHLHCITRKGHGIPPQPLKFFRKIQEHVLQRNMGIIALATFRKSVVAGIMLFHHGKKAIYKYGASNLEGKECRANNLVMWEAIRWYRQKGVKEFCFGRTEGTNQGLREYKLGYGASEYDLPYYKYDLSGNRVVRKSAEDASGRLERYYQKVPIPFSRIIGTLLYRHVG